MNLISKRAAAATAALLGLASCGLLGGGDRATLYRIGHQPGPAAAGERSGGIPLVIARPQLPAGAAGDRILTVSGREAAYVAEARWVSGAPDLIREALAAAVARNAPSVYVPAGAAGSGHVLLTTRFSVFAAFYDEGPDSPPVVRLAAQSELRRSGGSAPVALREHVQERRASDNRVSAIVEAFDAASLALADDIARWTESELGGGR